MITKNEVMKKLSLNDLENISAKGPKLCYGTALYLAMLPLGFTAGLVVASACYVASL